MGGELSTPNIGYYNTTKAALGFMTRQLAAELAPQVRVKAVASGLVETDIMAAVPEAELVAHGLCHDISTRSRERAEL